jgi:two-component system sensor histidine kinase KdpD
MIQRRQLHPWWVGYGLAVLAVVLATGLIAFVFAVSSVPPFLLFVLAAGASSALGRIGPGLVAALLAFLVSDFFFIPPVGRLTLNHHSATLGAYYTLAALMGYISASRALRQARSTPTDGNEPDSLDQEDGHAQLPSPGRNGRFNHG